MNAITEETRIIEKIRKLLAMAGDAGSPNEAAIAARRARALMDKHQIDYDYLDSTESDGFDEAIIGKSKQRFDLWLQGLAIAVAKLNDAQVKFDVAGRNKRLKFQGLESDVALCVQLFDYLADIAQAQYKASAKEHGFKGRTLKTQWLKGFSVEIDTKVKAIMKERAELKAANGRSLVVVKSELVAQKYGAASYSRRASYSKFDPDAQRAREAGAAAGRKTDLSRSVGAEA